jgi:transposase
MRTVAPLALHGDDEAELRRLASARSVPAGLARRAQIVLLAAEGLPHTKVAERAGTTVPTVRHWRNRYLAGGIGALRDAGRSGRPRSVDEVEIVLRTLEPPPERLGVTRWSSRLLAAELGVAPSTVVGVWQSYGLRPWRSEGFRFSTDPELRTTVRDVIGLYLEPPERAIVLCVDDGSPGAAPERGRPAAVQVWPRIPAQPAHDHVRGGATIVLAALEAAARGIGADARHRRHRPTGLLQFLEQISAARPADELHVVRDGHRRHGPAAVRAWLAKHPRITLHLTPPGCSWLNMVEIFFLIVTRQAARRGSLVAVRDLTTAIDAFIDGRNDRCQPFSWIKDAGGTIARIKRKESI